MNRGYAFIAAAVGWFAIIGQYFLANGTRTGPALAEGTIIYFSFFSTIANILVAAALTAVAFAPDSRLGKFFGGPNGATPVAVYITVTAILFWFLLRPITHPTGLGILLNALHHYVMPAVFVVYWLVFVPKGQLRLYYILDWLLLPVVFGAYTLAHGQASGFYPYWFVDVSKLGLETILREMAALLVFFALVGAVYILIDRLLGWRLRQETPPEPAAAPTENLPVTGSVQPTL